ncbi:MAG: ABC transporter ATP-binding protein [Acetobacteraceae bacterium]|nr:ABC transporter ATP-binding protein [Acetobacteraceae bacterium]
MSAAAQAANSAEGGAARGGALMRVSGVEMRFGGIVALDGVSFDVGHREICGLIGPNGSGKTTMFNCISGFYRYTVGDIVFDGTSIKDLARHRMVELGIGRTFQNVALFRSMTVRQNMMVGHHYRGTSGFLSNALRLPRARADGREAARQADELIELLELGAQANLPVGGLPFGWQKRVELGRAMIAAPKLLLLDEPAAGLNHGEVDELGALIKRLRSHFSLSILLVEHHMSLVMQVSDRVVALEFGRKIADGTPEEVQRDPEVIRAYLGEGEEAAHV